MESRARNSLHEAGGLREKNEEGMGDVQRIAMGYSFMSKEDETNPRRQEMSWLVESMCAQLRTWGHAGGAEGELIAKSDGEPAMLAVRNGVML